MRLNHLYLFILSLMSFSCQKQTNIDGVEYPEGIITVDLETQSDCSLSDCSSERITRLKANGAIAEVLSEGNLAIYWGGDSFIKLYVCEELESISQKDQVKIWGDLKDACGYYSPIYPYDETYIVHISKLTKL